MVLGPAAVLALQRSVGNSVVARALAGDREEPDAAMQRSAVDQALSSPGRPLTPDVRAEMESRLGADFSDVRVHTDAVAHESARAVDANAYTTGSHIVFERGRYDTASAQGRRTLAHELTHVLQQRSGPVDGTDTGDGLRVSDPSDVFERAAEANATRVMAGPTRSSRQEEAETASEVRPASPTAVPVQRAKKPKGKAAVLPPSESPAETPAPAEESLFAYICRKLGEHNTQFAKMGKNERLDALVDVGVLFDASDPDSLLYDSEQGFEKALRDTASALDEYTANAQFRPRFEVAGAGTSDWAGSETTAAHERLREGGSPWGRDTTLHHKIARARLSQLNDAANEMKGKDPAVARFFEVVDKIGASVGKTGHLNSLLNMPANLEMGPAADNRLDDPGSGFDPNYDVASGSMTPRSEDLAEVNKMIESGNYDWAVLAQRLEDAHDAHMAAHAGTLLSPPVEERWAKKGGKYVKHG